MNLIKKISWNNLHLYFFYLFLFSIPFQTRKVFLTEHSFYSGAFTEYATFFVYASDILLILTLIFWLVFNKKIFQKAQDSLKFSTERLQRGGNKLSITWLLLIIFILWLIINAMINNNYTEINVFYIFKFIELSLLLVYVHFNLRSKKRLITALSVVSFTGFFQGLVAIYQFVYQCPLFKNPLFHRLTGESTVYPQVEGIAKIIVDNEKLVRAYGTFPHPNLLGGFLIASILVSIYLLLKHKNYFLSILTSSFKYNNINSSKSQVRNIFLLFSLFWVVFIFTQITALLFTFSRTAWVGFLISLFLVGIFYIYHSKIVSRETIEKNKEFLVIFLLTVVIIFTYSPYINSRLNREGLINNHSSSNYLPSNYAINDRIFYNIVSRETISNNFIFGSGPGTFIFQINNYLTKNNINQKLEPWQYQPAHNIYLLIISEIGIIGFVIFALFVIKIVVYNFMIIKKPLNKRFLLNNNSNNSEIVSRETISDKSNKELNYYLIAIFIAFLFIGLFDHYFWTLQQGRLMFWFVLGLILVNSYNCKNKS